MSQVRKCFTSRYGKEGRVVEADFCLSPTTRILTHEFDHKPIKDIQIGDTLVGFEEYGASYGARKFLPSVVVGKKFLRRESRRLHLSDGTYVDCSTDHNWLARPKTNNAFQWVSTHLLRVGDRLSKVVDVWDNYEHCPDEMWMGGFLDGEGWISHASGIGVAQNRDVEDEPTWNKMLPILEKHFPILGMNKNKSSSCVSVRPYGVRTAWKGVGVFKPVRLLAQLQRTYAGTIIRSKRNVVQTIVEIEELGEIEVVALETSTKTFIAEGMLSHNCQLEVVVQAMLTKSVALIGDINSGMDMHRHRAAAMFAIKPADVTPKQRQLAKQCSFQLAYGAGYKSMALKLGLSESITKRFVNEFYARYPEIKAWNVANQKEVESGSKPSPVIDKHGVQVRVGYLSASTGRKYAFMQKEYMGTYGFSPTEISNYPIQGTAADIVALFRAKLYRILIDLNEPSILPICTVHDSVVFDCPVDKVELLTALLDCLMSNLNTLLRDVFPNLITPIQLKLDVKAGVDWMEQVKVAALPTGEFS